MRPPLGPGTAFPVLFQQQLPYVLSPEELVRREATPAKTIRP